MSWVFIVQQNEQFFNALSALYSIWAMGLEEDEKIHQEYRELVAKAIDDSKFPPDSFEAMNARLLKQFLQRHEHHISQYLVCLPKCL